VEGVETRFSFESVSAEDYEALRPGYAPEAIAWVARRGRLDHRSLVVDLAAGTGQLSRGFAKRVVRLLAVEPAANMRAVFASRLPDVAVVGGSAERIPIDDGCADAVVVGNAFHHFDAAIALSEIGRVLRGGGVLALFWAHPCRGVEELAALDRVEEAIRPVRDASAIADAYRRWETPPEPVVGFTPFERAEFPLAHTIPAARLADLYATSSDIASLPHPVRDEVIARIRRASGGLPEILTLSYRTVVDLCARPLTIPPTGGGG
jgi:SAM-dependent methyltransferase